MEGLLDMLALAQYANDEIPACSGAKFFFPFFLKILNRDCFMAPRPPEYEKKIQNGRHVLLNMAISLLFFISKRSNLVCM